MLNVTLLSRSGDNKSILLAEVLDANVLGLKLLFLKIFFAELNGLKECLDGGVVGGRHEKGDLDASSGVGNIGREVHTRRLMPHKVDGLPGIPADGYVFYALVAIAGRVVGDNRLGVLRGADAKGDDFVAILDAVEEDFGHVAIASAARPYVVALGRVGLEPRKVDAVIGRLFGLFLFGRLFGGAVSGAAGGLGRLMKREWRL